MQREEGEGGQGVIWGREGEGEGGKSSEDSEDEIQPVLSATKMTKRVFDSIFGYVTFCLEYLSFFSGPVALKRSLAFLAWRSDALAMF